MVQLHLANDVTQRGLRKFFNSVGQVVNLVNSLKGVYNLKIQQRINLHLNVVFGNYILFIKIVNLLAQVDSIRVAIPPIGKGYNSFCTVYERNDDVNSGFQRSIILT